jgi:molybdopterin converting factor small subunit
MSINNKKIARVKKTIKINPEDIKISLENLIDDVNKKTSSIQKEVDCICKQINKLQGKEYQYKEKFVIDEEKPIFTNEIDELDYIHESLIFKYAQLENKLNTLINAYKKLLKKHIKNIKEKNEELQKELGDIFEKNEKLNCNVYKYKKKFVIDEDKPKFTNEIDELDYTYSILETQQSDLKGEIKALNAYHKEILRVEIENVKLQIINYKNNIDEVKNTFEKYKFKYPALIRNHAGIKEKESNIKNLNDVIENLNNNIKNLNNDIRKYFINNIILQHNIYNEISKNLQIIKLNYETIETFILDKIKKYNELCSSCRYLKECCICDKCNRCENRKFDRCRCTISTKLRIDVWDKYIGLNKNSHKCLCCLKNDIQFKPSTFHCGHIKSRYNGGSISIHNLRPICRKCNKEMGILDMNKYIQTCHPRLI